MIDANTSLFKVEDYIDDKISRLVLGSNTQYFYFAETNNFHWYYITLKHTRRVHIMKLSTAEKQFNRVRSLCKKTRAFARQFKYYFLMLSWNYITKLNIKYTERTFTVIGFYKVVLKHCADRLHIVPSISDGLYWWHSKTYKQIHYRFSDNVPLKWGFCHGKTVFVIKCSCRLKRYYGLTESQC